MADFKSGRVASALRTSFSASIGGASTAGLTVSVKTMGSVRTFESKSAAICRRSASSVCCKAYWACETPICDVAYCCCGLYMSSGEVARALGHAQVFARQYGVPVCVFGAADQLQQAGLQIEPRLAQAAAGHQNRHAVDIRAAILDQWLLYG